MKKVAFVVLLTAVLLGGCGGKKTDKPAASSAESSSTAVSSTTAESTVESTVPADLTYFYPDKKDTVELKDLHVSVELGNENYKELDIMSANFEPQKSVFIYIDGQLTNMDADLATGLRKPTPITVDQITKGVHSLELAQYEGDDDTTEPVLYVRSSYEIEE